MSQGYDPNGPAFQDPLLSSPMRINSTAIASTNSGPTAPSNPVEGQLWMDNSDSSNVKLNSYISNAWKTILSNIQAGAPSQTNIGKLVFTQSLANVTWNIQHNLGSVDVVVSIVDTTASPEEQMLYDTLEIVDNNNIQITFTAAQAGRATVVG